MELYQWADSDEYAILLDVDNGPTGLTRTTNDWLYGWEGFPSTLCWAGPSATG